MDRLRPAIAPSYSPPTQAPPTTTTPAQPTPSPPPEPTTPAAEHTPPVQPPALPTTPTTPPEPVSVEGCLYIGGYTRVFIFQRDDERGVCARFVLVSPEDDDNPFDLTGLSVPRDWTVDEMSAFPCAPDGSLVNGATPNYYMTASGSVDFVVGQGGLPTHASIEVLLMNPSEDPAALPYPDPLILGQQISERDLELPGSCPLP